MRCAALVFLFIIVLLSTDALASGRNQGNFRQGNRSFVVRRNQHLHQHQHQRFIVVRPHGHQQQQQRGFLGRWFRSGF